jgi:hypothetical protein
MPRKKAASDQAVMTAILPPGPAERAISAAKGQSKAAKFKLPTAEALAAMIERFRAHSQHVRDLLADTQIVAEWPPADPDRDGNLHELLMNFLRPAEIRAVADEVITCDTTLAATISDLTTLLDDMAPGAEQGAWARAILEPNAPEKTTRVAGMPSKSRPKAKS